MLDLLDMLLQAQDEEERRRQMMMGVNQGERAPVITQPKPTYDKLLDLNRLKGLGYQLDKDSRIELYGSGKIFPPKLNSFGIRYRKTF